MSTPETSPLLESAAQLRAELDLLELRLQREVGFARGRRGERAPDEFAGLYIPDEEIDGYLAEREPQASAGARQSPLDARIGAAERALDDARTRALAAGRLLRLEHLRRVYALGAAEHAALVACLAPELELRFERYFAYLQNDVTRTRPCAQLLDRLCFAGAADFTGLQRLLAAEDSLVALRILEPVKGEGGLAGRELRVARGVVQFLLEVDGPDPELLGVDTWGSGRALAGGTSYLEQHAQHIERLLARVEREGRLPYVHLRAPDGCGKEDLVLALAHELEAGVLECDAAELCERAGDWKTWLEVAARDLRLRGAFLWIRHADELLTGGETRRGRVRALGAGLRAQPSINVVLSGEGSPFELGDLLQLPLVALELVPPSVQQRLELWREVARDEGLALATPQLEGLAGKFRLGPGQIRAALAGLRGESPEPEDAGEPARALERACRAASSPTLDAHAQKIVPRYRWSDLVLPHDALDQLREIRDAVRFRARVHGDWGFESKFSLGRGVSALFSGPSGTGKTMSAEVLAGDLGLDLYKVDLSSVVSKYIGETEKNLSRMFREAERAHAILLFDEADALFGRRSEVKDSHDRYANIEVNFLLQRMDESEGILLLTTNMLKNLDPAFTRRIQHTVEFPAPDEAGREQLWCKVFPAQTPLAEDLDLSFLARRFKLSGASIKNIATNSAFLAASNGGIVDMGHVVTAVRREYRKLGKLISPAEFGAYAHLAAAPAVSPEREA